MGTRSRYGLLTLTVASALALCGAASAAVVQSATGSGMFIQFLNGGEFSRTFAFTAQTRADGTTTGQAELVNRFSGARIHIAIDCLSVALTTATMSGTITHSNNPNFPVGLGAVFSVTDNGEGANSPPDTVSLVSFDIPSPAFACTSFAVPPPFVPITGGNVQVRP